ncbi:MAG: hypothetical protein FWE69_06205 [Clostridiales bacterium]|nr:hypothetical protein [Clostridiales bacterium]
MNNILEDLYFGNINPNENTWTRDSEYLQFGKVSVEAERALADRLEGETKKQFDRFVDATGHMHAIEASLRFAEGFRLGAKIMLAVLAEEREV